VQALIESYAERERNLHNTLTDTQSRFSRANDELERVKRQMDELITDKGLKTTLLSKQDEIIADLERKNSALHRELTEASARHREMILKMEQEAINSMQEIRLLQSNQASKLGTTITEEKKIELELHNSKLKLSDASVVCFFPYYESPSDTFSENQRSRGTVSISNT
jgi:hypothetical protein